MQGWTPHGAGEWKEARKQGSEEERKNLTWRVAEQEVVWLDVGIHQAAVVQEGDSHLRELICCCIVWVLFYFRRSIPVHCSAMQADQQQLLAPAASCRCNCACCRPSS